MPMISEALKKHKQGLIIASLGWIINVPYWIYEITVKGVSIIGHSKGLLLEHLFITGTIPVFMLLGYIYDKKVTLEKKLIRYSDFLGEKVEERTRDLERKVRELQGLYEISDLLRKEAEPKPISRDVTKKVADLMEVDECCIIFYDKENMEFHPLKPAYGMSDEQLNALEFSLEDSSHTLEKWPEKEPLVSNDPSKDERLMDELTRYLDKSSLLLAKLLVAGEFLGILWLAGKKGEGFTGEDARLAEIIASRIGAALHTMRLITELRQSEEYHRGLMENAADAIFVLNSEGRCLDANSKAVDITGYSKEELLKMNIKELFPPYQQAVLAKKLTETLEIGRGACGDLLILNKTKDAVPVEISSSTMEISGENVVMTILRDVTERKKMEKEIIESNERLRMAYEELKKLDKVKDELIARVSHELRTPLTIVKGVLEVLKNEETREDRMQLYQTGLNALKRQNAIIGDLIDISKVQRERLKLFPGITNLVPVVEAVISEVSPFAEDRDITIRKEFEDNIPKVWADPTQLTHALRNLLNNAIKFNRDRGEVGIYLRANKNIKAVEVCIRDTGIGIPEEHLDRIFDRFYQVDGSLTRRYGGTGLGLAIVKEIIEAHKGTITVESKAGEGSVFCFTLPAAGQYDTA